MAALGEAALYAPVKRFLEARGYEVKGEVCGCDLVARHVDDRGDEPPVIVELKLRFTLALLLQGIDRLAVSERVYLAVPRPPRSARGLSPEAPAIRRLCRRVGLGLMIVGRDGVAIIEEPAPYRPRTARHRAHAADGRVRPPRRRPEYRRIAKSSAGHRLSPGRAAPCRACSPRRPDAACRTARSERRRRRRPHPAAQCLRLVCAGRTRRLRFVGRRAARRSDLCRCAGGACRPRRSPARGGLMPAPPDDAAAAPPDRRLFRPRLAAAHPAPGAGLRRLGVRRRFRPRAAPLPHPGIVRPVVRRRRSGRAAGDRAVEHGPALPGASGVSLRAADVARLRAVRAARSRRCCSGSAAPRCGASCAPTCRNARRPWSMPTRP